ncbi:MAG: sulfurtransferase-like selenium metabolism protein YedF [Tepidanaerobacteraceae bacterium]|nr:sulfurtransferase-like selenium metabolism protein YedF [Tepidanaerobacteraceae bacterium]
MEIYVDARGKTCSQPVLMIKKALESLDEGKIITAVDNDIAKDDVTKLIQNQKLNYSIKEESGVFEIIIEKGSSGTEVTVPVTVEEPFKVNTLTDQYYIIMITKDTLGEGAEELGKLLLRNYLYTLLEVDQLPLSLLFVNSGIYLTTEGSQVIDILKQFQEKGVEILSCETCLDYYQLKDKLLVGRVTNMHEIVEKTIMTKTVSI